MALATLLIKRLKRLIWPVGQLKLPEIAENRPRGLLLIYKRVCNASFGLQFCL